MNPILMYFFVSVTATIAGLILYMAIENLRPVDNSDRSGREVTVAVIFSALFTPIGAWLFSAIRRLAKLRHAS